MHKKIERGCTKCMFNCTKSILLIVEEFPLADESLIKLKRNVIGIDCRRLKDGTWKACYWRHPLSFKVFSVFHASLLFWQVYEGIHSRRATECLIQFRCKVWENYFSEISSMSYTLDKCLVCCCSVDRSFVWYCRVMVSTSYRCDCNLVM